MKPHSVLNLPKKNNEVISSFGLCDISPHYKRLTLNEYFHKRAENIVKNNNRVVILTWIAFAVSKRKRGDEYLMRNKSKKLLSVATM